MAKKNLIRPKTIIVLLKIFGLLLLLFFPVQALSTKFNITIESQISQNLESDIKEILETITAKINQDFKYNNTNPVDVIIFTPSKSMRSLGKIPPWVEDSYKGKMYLAVYNDDIDMRMLTTQIVYEYTQIILTDLTNDNCPRWFREGLGRYAEYRHGTPPHLYMLAMAYSADLLIPWDKINSQITNGDETQIILAYQQSYSFVYFLIKTYGMAKLITLLHALGTKLEFNTAIQQTYDVSLEKLQKDWHQQLNTYLKDWSRTPIVE